MRQKSAHLQSEGKCLLAIDSKVALTTCSLNLKVQTLYPINVSNFSLCECFSHRKYENILETRLSLLYNWNQPESYDSIDEKNYIRTQS